MKIHKLDVLGEVCPVPLFRTQQTTLKAAEDDKVVVLTDFSRAVRNIMEWAEDMGYCCDVNDIETGVWEVTLTKRCICGGPNGK
jgi:TusA-related sulfurtransferase